MNIDGTETNLRHKALEIYISGCKPPHCAGCHNPELWDFSKGDPWQEAIRLLGDKISALKESGLVEIVWLLGGEPLDQDEES